jgi:hypothetical protein
MTRNYLSDNAATFTIEDANKSIDQIFPGESENQALRKSLVNLKSEIRMLIARMTAHRLDVRY